MTERKTNIIKHTRSGRERGVCRGNEGLRFSLRRLDLRQESGMESFIVLNFRFFEDLVPLSSISKGSLVGTLIINTLQFWYLSFEDDDKKLLSRTSQDTSRERPNTNDRPRPWEMQSVLPRPLDMMTEESGNFDGKNVTEQKLFQHFGPPKVRLNAQLTLYHAFESYPVCLSPITPKRTS